MSKGNVVLVVVILIALIGGGFLFFNRDNDPAMESKNMMEDESMEKEVEEVTMEDDSMMMETSFSGNVLAGDVSPLINFNKADYKKALKEKKLIVLYFYANWCPTCKEETAKALYPAFDELNDKDVIGFRVNYNDNETDTDEKDLAREFGVAYQHTKVFLKNGERVLKSPESWNTSRYLLEVANALK